jgi:putative ABC transport system substrate-binding protein
MAATIGRRRVTGFVVVSVATWPLALRAQQQALPVIGLLLYGSRGVGPDRVRSFRQGLAEAGIIEGRDATIEYRWAEYQTERLPKLANDLVSRGISVLAAPGNTPGRLGREGLNHDDPNSLLRRRRPGATWVGRQP